MEEQKYAYWLANISGVGIKTIHQLYKYCDNAREIYELGPGQLLHIHNLTEKTADLIVQSKKNWDVDGQWEQFLERGIQFYSMENPKYPKKLRHIYDMPYAIYVIGELPDEKEKSAAIVGARNCSPYGKKAAQEFGKKLAEAGVNLISGMARGIDSMGHRGALLAGGRTYAVLGCGVNIVYPPENWELYEQIAKHGGIYGTSVSSVSHIYVAILDSETDRVVFYNSSVPQESHPLKHNPVRMQLEDIFKDFLKQ